MRAEIEVVASFDALDSHSRFETIGPVAEGPESGGLLATV